MSKKIKKLIPTTLFFCSIFSLLYIPVFSSCFIHSVQAWRYPITESTVDEIIKAADYTNPTTRDFAVKIAARYDWSEGRYNLAQVVSIYEYLYDNWKYVSDPYGIDYFSPASRTIDLGLSGDCDDFAILMAAVIKAIGGTPRLTVAYGSEGNHMYTEVYMGNEEHAKKIAKEIQNRYAEKPTIHYLLSSF